MPTPKSRQPKKRKSKYEEKLQVEASFTDIIGAVIQDAEKKSAKKKAAKKS